MKKVFNAEKKLYEAQLTEEHIVRQIMEGLALHRDIRVWRIVERIPWGKKASTAGISDIQGLLLAPWYKCEYMPGGTTGHAIPFPMPFFIEVKKPGGRATWAQIDFIEQRQREGCIACFAYGWDDVVKAFAEKGIKL